jgi:hypothetical protein
MQKALRMLSTDLIRSNLADEQPYVVSFERQNIEFTCRPESADHATVRQTAFH